MRYNTPTCNFIFKNFPADSILSDPRKGKGGRIVESCPYLFQKKSVSMRIAVVKNEMKHGNGEEGWKEEGDGGTAR